MVSSVSDTFSSMSPSWSKSLTTFHLQKVFSNRSFSVEKGAESESTENQKRCLRRLLCWFYLFAPPLSCVKYQYLHRNGIFLPTQHGKKSNFWQCFPFSMSCELSGVLALLSLWLCRGT
ncbi:hypothetical protein ILYODFUR_010061 [Ilyodon furcidens]|uniref:Uncharacterized protein n=1 Tax=Ilyodon furcidens TaxID=33524 RepID=A0ABV0UET1_9TELE